MSKHETSLDEVRSAHVVAEAIGRDYADATARLHRLVAQALDAGVRAVDLAAALDVTRGRIYQLARKAD